MPTIIGSSIVIDGELTGEEDLVVHGTVKGKINTRGKLVVDQTAVVEADIETPTVTISGRVTGNVSASERVELKTEAKMVGDIRAPRILIAEGASFKGSVDMNVG